MTIGKQNLINQRIIYYAVTSKHPTTKATLYLSLTVESYEWTPHSKASFTGDRDEALQWSKQYGGTVEEVVPF